MGKDDMSRRDSRDPRSFLRYGAVIAVLVIVLGGVVLLFSGDDSPPPRKVHEITIVTILQPPPPPPPPPPQQMPEPKMVEQTPITEPAIKEEKPVEKPKDEPARDAKNDEPPPGPLSLDQKAEGPGDLFNLGGKPGGTGLLGGGGGGSRWGWYAGIVQQQIEAALRANNKTRNAVMQIQVRLWSDATGRVSRVQLVSSTGDTELDKVIQNEILAGLTLREPPPKDMPMPIVTRITARRSG